MDKEYQKYTINSTQNPGESRKKDNNRMRKEQEEKEKEEKEKEEKKKEEKEKEEEINKKKS